jgi:hypothetical protein
MSFTDAVQLFAVEVDDLRGVEAPSSSLEGDGQPCRRCEGKGWFRWHGVMRWCSPSCVASHLDVDIACTVEPRKGLWD